MKKLSDNLEGVKFIYFDIGNVLFSFSGGLESLTRLFDKSIEEVKNYWLTKDDDICRGVLNPQDFWDEAKQYFNYKGDDIKFVDFWVEHFYKIQKGHDLAFKLSKSYKIGLITNIYPEVFEKVVHSDLIPQIDWDCIIKSCDYGFVKPERELFNIALKKTGLKADEILLIDDIQENCDKAIENGWRSVLFKQ